TARSGDGAGRGRRGRNALRGRRRPRILRLMEGHVSAGTVAGGGLPAAPPARAGAALALVCDYVALTKPRIIGLLLVTTVTTIAVARPSGLSLALILWTVLGGYLAAGGAGAINHYVERDRDARMDRTCDRPIAPGRLRPRRALPIRDRFPLDPAALLGAGAARLGRLRAGRRPDAPGRPR